MMFGRVTKQQLFAMPEANRKRVYAQQLVNSAITHAKWAALKYSRALLREGCTLNGVIITRRDRTPAEALEVAGGHDGILRAMEMYQVKPALREYATRITIALVESGK